MAPPCATRFSLFEVTKDALQGESLDQEGDIPPKWCSTPVAAVRSTQKYPTYTKLASNCFMSPIGGDEQTKVSSEIA